MGLINLKTNLRTLKYGKDRIGGTSSNEPYIRKSLTTNYFDTPNDDFLGVDILGRQGSLRSLADDVSRLSKFLVDGKSPRGSLFVLKQQLLEKASPKLPYGPNRIFNPANMLAQIGVSGTGIHFDREGLSLIIGFDQKYEYQTRTFYNDDSSNRLVLLLDKTSLDSKKSSSIVNFDQKYEYQTRTFHSSNTDNRLALLYDTKISKTINQPGIFNITGQSDPTTLISYVEDSNPNGNPNRVTINRVTDTSTYKPGEGQNGQYKNIFVLTNTEISTKGDLTITAVGIRRDTGFNSVTNFVKEVNDSAPSTPEKKRILGRLTDYNVFNRVKKYGTGDQGNDANLDRQAYYSGAPVKTAGVDLINYNTLYTSENVKTGQGYDDIIKFHIAVLNNDNPEFKTYIHFRAYLKGLSDSFGASWDSFKYMGRGEDFYKYNGFSRDISLSFDILVGSRIELFPVYDKLNYLGSIMAPDYSEGGFMRGNIIQLTVGDYINNMYGVLGGINYSFPDDSSWDIAKKDDGEIDKNSAELPLLINVGSFSFKPIHNFVPSTVSDRSNPYNSSNSRFISLGDTGKGYSGRVANAGNSRVNTLNTIEAFNSLPPSFDFIA